MPAGPGDSKLLTGRAATDGAAGGRLGAVVGGRRGVPHEIDEQGIVPALGLAGARALAALDRRRALRRAASCSTATTTG